MGIRADEIASYLYEDIRVLKARVKELEQELAAKTEAFDMLRHLGSNAKYDEWLRLQSKGVTE